MARISRKHRSEGSRHLSPRGAVALAALLALLVSGCAQHVDFSEPAGTTVLVEGHRLGTIPFAAGLQRGRVLAVELQPAGKVLDKLKGQARAQSVKGALVLPRSAPATTFKLTSGQLKLALESDTAVTATDTGPEGLSLYFKGSAAGVATDVPAVLAYLPPSSSWLSETAENLGEGLVVGSRVILVTAVVILALWGASRTCVGQDATHDR